MDINDVRKVLLGVALWNTVVFVINVTVWPAFFNSEMLMVTMPLRSQMLPVVIPVIMWALTYEPVRDFFKGLVR